MNPMMASCACGLALMVPYLLAAGGLVVGGAVAVKYLVFDRKRQSQPGDPSSLGAQPR